MKQSYILLTNNIKQLQINSLIYSSTSLGLTMECIVISFTHRRK